MFLVVLLLSSASGESEPTTTRTYDLEIPGPKTIRIIEGEPLWSTTPNSNSGRSFRDENNEDADDSLYHFVTTYSDTARKNKLGDRNGMESVELITKANEESRRGADSERSKNWDVINYQKQNHPFEDKKGWVSMEPVPWSISKISKWESKYKTSSKPWEDDYDTEEPQVTPERPPWNTNKPINNYDDIYFSDKKQESKPLFTKPTAIYNQKVHVDYNKNKYHKHDQNCGHQSSHEDDYDIITDGLPSNFPQQYEANRRKSTDEYPDGHPFSGNGDWVLLSTTKGYKNPPNRQRALQVDPQSVGAHRTVRLTVLPPLKNSKVNMTTSHGGLLQVESTFQTVEQAHKQFTKKSKLKRKRPQRTKKPIAQKFVSPALTTTRRNQGPDSSAVLAAVGAGIIPATMAMLVPMALGRRRKREIESATTVPLLQITPPRYLY